MKKTWIVIILVLIGTLFLIVPLVNSATAEEGTTNLVLEINGKEKEIRVNTSTLNQFIDEVSQETNLTLEEIKQNIEFEIEEKEHEEEIEVEIEVEIEEGVTEAEIEINDTEKEIILNNTEKDAIIQELHQETNLTLEEIKQNIEFEIEEKEHEED